MKDIQNTAASNSDGRSIGATLLCFAISGMCALIYELCWQRLLLRILGSTLPAVTLVLCIFMSGLAVGSYFGNRSLKWHPLKCYAVLECFIASFGALSIWLFSGQTNSVVSTYDAAVNHLFNLHSASSFDSFNQLFVSRAVFATVSLLLPTCAMGATFPLVAKFLHRLGTGEHYKGQAYIANLLGAAFGSVVAGFVLLPNFGITFTLACASLSSCLAAIVMMFVARKTLPYKSDKKEILRTQHAGDLPKDTESPALITAVAVNGAVGMCLEVVWSRLFSLLVGSSTYSVASVFALSLCGLAAGAVVWQKVSHRFKSNMSLLTALCCATALCLYLDLWLIQMMPWLFNINHESMQRTNSFGAYLFERVLVISLVVLPASFLCGGFFPVALRTFKTHDARGLGTLYSLSSVGSVIGAALSGFILIPVLGRMFTSGMESTICLLVAAELCTATMLVVASSSRKIFAIVPATMLVLLLVRPPWNQALMSSGIPFLSLPTKAATTKEIFDRVLSDSANNKLLFYREGLNTTVTVNANVPQNVIYLKNDGKVEAALPLNLNRHADTSDLTTHFMLGKLPVSINDAKEKSVFVVGLGSGATCGGALDSPSVKSLKVAEIEPTIFEIQHFFEPANGEPLRPSWTQNGRVIPFCGDARIALNGSNETYDVIISQPAEPWISGSSDLYTQEFWQIARNKLNARGCFCQWIQLYSIDPEYLSVLLRTFQKVFPNTYVYHYPRAGEIILLGTIEPLNQGVQLLNDSLIATPDSLKHSCDALGQKFRNLRLNTDDNLLTEYALPPKLYLSESLIEQNLAAITKPK